MDDLVKYLANNAAQVRFLAQAHFLLVLYSVGLATIISVALALVLHTNRLTPPSWHRALRAGSQEVILLVASAVLTVLSRRHSPTTRCRS